MSQRNRGVVLTLHDAYAIARWLEFTFMDQRFFNPIEAHEAKHAAIEAMRELTAKLMVRQTRAQDGSETP